MGSRYDRFGFGVQSYLPPSEAQSAGRLEYEAQRIIDNYLDHQGAPLVGMMPFEERVRLRQEAGDYLERRTAAYLLDGHSPREAALMAIREYGDSRDVADEILQNWLHRHLNGKIAKRIGLAEIYATILFGLSNAAVQILQQIHISAVALQVDPSPITFGLSPAELRHFIPSPLPLPERSPTFALIVASLFLLPIVAGCLTGWLAPVRPARAVYHVQVCLTVYTFFSGVLMLPACYGLMAAVLQVIYWIPVGCLCAHIGAIVKRRHCCRFSEISDV